MPMTAEVGGVSEQLEEGVNEMRQDVTQSPTKESDVKKEVSSTGTDGNFTETSHSVCNVVYTCTCIYTLYMCICKCSCTYICTHVVHRVHDCTCSFLQEDVRGA